MKLEAFSYVRIFMFEENILFLKDRIDIGRDILLLRTYEIFIGPERGARDEKEKLKNVLYGALKFNNDAYRSSGPETLYLKKNLVF